MDLQRTVSLFLLSISANGYSHSTIELYTWALNLLSTYLENPDMKEIKPDSMDRFWNWLRNDYKPKRTNGNTDPLAGRSLENVWTAERSFFKWCEETGKVRKRPDVNIHQPAYAERIIEPISEEDLLKLIEAAKKTRISDTKDRKPFSYPRTTAARDVALLMVLGETGVRVSECSRITRGDIDFNAGSITVQPFGTGRKTKHRILDIGRNTRMALWEYILWREEREGKSIEPDELIFMSLQGNPMNKDSIRQVIDEIGRSAGLVGVHPHRFRHFFASMMAADDMGENELMEKLGQTTDRMARRYVHLSRVKRKTRTSIIDTIKRR